MGFQTFSRFKFCIGNAEIHYTTLESVLFEEHWHPKGVLHANHIGHC